jgi:thiamine-phosphate pyrophosphorylase
MPESFGLYLVLTEPRVGYERCTEAAVEQHVRYVQLRMKKRPREDVVAMAHRLRAITRGSVTRFIVNDDVTIASEVDADGVHLGQQDTSLAHARTLWPNEGKIFGLSTHDALQEREARSMRPDYVGVGPVFATPTKEAPDPVLGPERASEIVRASPLTTVAIGGIDSNNLPGLVSRGISNFAVVRAVCDSSDPSSAIRALMDTWRQSSPVQP